MKELFKLWDEHTVGFCRVLFVLTIGVTFSRVFVDVLCCFLLIMWLIIKTGYEQKWNDHPTEKVCTGKRCPMQVGYDVKNCKDKDCIYRTETEKGGGEE